MSQLTDIYNSLMNDPDIIPPKKMSKDTYALTLAEQRIKQHENNAEALEMGFAKEYSAVNKLATFVNPPEASPEADIFLEKKKAGGAKPVGQMIYTAPKGGGKKNPPAGKVTKTTLWYASEKLDIPYNAVSDLETKGFSRQAIRNLISENNESEEPIDIKDLADMQDAKTDDEIQEGMDVGEYDEELGDISTSASPHSSIKTAAADRKQEVGQPKSEELLRSQGR